MMELESGKDKVKKICDVLRKETLDPARHEAQKMIEEAIGQKERILQEAKAAAAEMMAQTERDIQKREAAFHASMTTAGRQVIAELKHAVEQELFHKGLKSALQKATQDPKIIAEMIQALIKSIEKESDVSELRLELPENFSKESLFSYLAKEVLDRFKTIEIGHFHGGVKIKLVDENLSIEITDESLLNWIGQFLRNDVREFLFQS